MRKPLVITNVTDGWTDRRTDGRTDGQIPPVFYRTSSPSGPLPCSPSLKFTVMQRRATGIADHIVPLGDLLRFYTQSSIASCFHRDVYLLSTVPIFCTLKS